MCYRVVKEITDARSVDVGKAVQTARKVGRIVKSPEYTAKLRVKHVLCSLPKREKYKYKIILVLELRKRTAAHVSRSTTQK